MLFSEAKAKIGTWTDIECVPTGKIETKEQYDYLKYYVENTPIDDRYIKSFEESKGKYIHMGSWFGGAAFYLYMSDEPQGDYDYRIEDKNGAIVGYTKYEEDFSYGKLGKIEFD